MTTETRIWRSALKLFGSRGFAATSVRDIAKASGVTSASLYHYVKSKDELLVNVVLDAMAGMVEPAREIELTQSARHRLELLVRNHIRAHLSDREVWEVVDEEWRRLDARRRAPIVAYRDDYESMWRRTIADGCADGTFAPCNQKLVTFALLAMCSSVYRWFDPRKRLTAEEVTEEHVRLAFNMLGVPPVVAVDEESVSAAL
jgi:AcrR family transcriptional regulator